jgi:hypothetical protein
MSDASGKVIADEFTQDLAGGHLRRHATWTFANGHRVEKRDDGRPGRAVDPSSSRYRCRAPRDRPTISN